MSQAAGALRRLAAHSPRFTRGLKTSGPTKKGTEKYSHEEIAYGDGHHGLRKGYHYVRPRAPQQPPCSRRRLCGA